MVWPLALHLVTRGAALLAVCSLMLVFVLWRLLHQPTALLEPFMGLCSSPKLLPSVAVVGMHRATASCLKQACWL